METARQVLTVLAVFAALGGALWALRRGGGAGWGGIVRRKPGRVEALERVALSPHHAIHLVRFGERTLLVASHAGGCTLLASEPLGEIGFGPEGGPR
jgi:hypothetical protein